MDIVGIKRFLNKNKDKTLDEIIDDVIDSSVNSGDIPLNELAGKGVVSAGFNNYRVEIGLRAYSDVELPGYSNIVYYKGNYYYISGKYSNASLKRIDYDVIDYYNLGLQTSNSDSYQNTTEIALPPGLLVSTSGERFYYYFLTVYGDKLHIFATGQRGNVVYHCEYESGASVPEGSVITVTKPQGSSQSTIGDFSGVFEDDENIYISWGRGNRLNSPNAYLYYIILKKGTWTAKTVDNISCEELMVPQSKSRYKPEIFYLGCKKINGYMYVFVLIRPGVYSSASNTPMELVAFKASEAGETATNFSICCSVPANVTSASRFYSAFSVGNSIMFQTPKRMYVFDGQCFSDFGPYVFAEIPSDSTDVFEIHLKGFARNVFLESGKGYVESSSESFSQLISSTPSKNKDGVPILRFYAEDAERVVYVSVPNKRIFIPKGTRFYSPTFEYGLNKNIKKDVTRNCYEALSDTHICVPCAITDFCSDSNNVGTFTIIY